MKRYKRFLVKLLLKAPTFKIRTIYRISLDLELQRQFKRLESGLVLDIGARKSQYKKFIPHSRYFRLDVDENSNPDICCNAHDIKWESNYFDTVIATEVIEHLYDPQRAIDEIFRLLKPGGKCILSATLFFPYHPVPKDYYRFTKDSLYYLFRNYRKVEVYHHGSRIQVLWLTLSRGLSGIVLNIFNPLLARIKVKETNFPCGFVVYAEK